MSFSIVTLKEINFNSEILKQVEDIFFLSTSVKSFASEERRLTFFKRWCGDYQTHYPQEFFVVMEEKKVLGYLSGCQDSFASLKVLDVPGLAVFEEQFEKFPAHLHINFHPDARGKGLGSLLVQHYMKVLKDQGIKGLHLTTSPDAQNVNFYLRLGFTHTVKREFKGSELYFMGAILE
nr:GNAT family N-acetyltransferase [Bacteriovorax sp. HI3]